MAELADAQRSGRCPSNWDVGSNPSTRTKHLLCAPIAQLAEQGPLKPKVAGSSPAGRTKRSSLYKNKRSSLSL